MSQLEKSRSNSSLKDNSKYKPVPNPAYIPAVRRSPVPKQSGSTNGPLASPFSSTVTQPAVQPSPQPVPKSSPSHDHQQPLASAMAAVTTDSNVKGHDSDDEQVPPPPPKEEKWKVSTRRSPQQLPVLAQNAHIYSPQMGSPNQFIAHVPPDAVPPTNGTPLKAHNIMANVRAQLQQPMSPQQGYEQGLHHPFSPNGAISAWPMGNGNEYADHSPSLSSPQQQQQQQQQQRMHKGASRPRLSVMETEQQRERNSRFSLGIFKHKEKHSGTPQPSISSTTSSTSSTPNFASSYTPQDQYVLADGVPVLHYVRAIWGFQAKIPSEMSFLANDLLAVIRKQPDGWWEAEIADPNRRQRGLIPSNYVTAE
ncbi:uncharacterized protein BYT42DRAFT_586127 [Radiomyces spectabilis]|uniref:uncharacterized protein n=1 Tax=Radiomyces spectabilis TaxID=64574 RepID=UPI00221EE9C1|nr:uncharacterized protein BYT42DRAFT_586127 [Radiomyces spectabilis]KAI8368315.1 hypothetical protein BYT42DRAFT_586127 [Radiomyces spectabilis]